MSSPGDLDLSVARLSGFPAGMQEPCLLADVDGRVVYANAAATETFGPLVALPGASLVALLADSIVSTDGDALEREVAIDRVIQYAWRSGRAVPTTIVVGEPPLRWRCEAWRLGTDGREGPLPYLAVHLRSHGRSVERFALLESQLEAMSREVHEHRVTSQRLRAATERLSTVFGSAPIGMAVAEADRGGKAVLTQANDAMGALVGVDAGQLHGLALTSILSSDERDAALLAIGQLAREASDAVEFDAFVRHSSGDHVAVTLSASRLGDDELNIGRSTVPIVLQFVDLTERRRYESQLRYLADHDVLTGLFNRRRFDEELESTVARVRRFESEAVVLLIDLDNFKGVNDTHGHATGDELLGRVARLIERRLRESDTAARHGGDEFAVLLPDTDVESAVFVADELRKDIVAASVIDGDGREVNTSVTIGVSPVTGRLSADQVLVEADIAMYEAKGAGRDRIGVADPDRDQPGAVQTGHSWLQRIRDSLRRDRFVLHAQPIVDLRSGEITRHEVLLRMQEDDGLVSPGQFLYIAERYGLIHAIDQWVLDQVVSTLERWQSDPDLGLASHTLSMNLSGATITDEATVSFIERRVTESGIDATRLVFELTETNAIGSLDRAAHFARRLESLGCAVALDDVGSGFGSFTYLKHLPARVIKIDGEYVRDLAANPVDQLIVKALVDVVWGMGNLTVAEWVEDAETLELLISLGVDYGQGYFFGAPGPLDEVEPAASWALPDLS